MRVPTATPSPVILLLLAALVLFAPAALAQIVDDEICDDETIEEFLECDVTKITMELDAPIQTATFWGSFCENPVVMAGQLDGTFHTAEIRSRQDLQVDVASEAVSKPDDLGSDDHPLHHAIWATTDARA